MLRLSIIFMLFMFSAHADELPEKHVELLPYVQEAPDQGKTGSCLYVASTGAMELLANRRDGITDPRPNGKYDLSESFLMKAPAVKAVGKSLWEKPVLKFNRGFGIHVEDWPYDAWRGTEVGDVWRSREFQRLPRVSLPQVETIALFQKGKRWSRNVLQQKHVEQIKRALVEHDSPVLINYNDNGFWHVILIVGYDDRIPGECYQINENECGTQMGAFFVRDSFGRRLELRDYDWFRVRGNAAFVIKEKR
jgi:hypothetical protein